MAFGIPPVTTSGTNGRRRTTTPTSAPVVKNGSMIQGIGGGIPRNTPSPNPTPTPVPAPTPSGEPAPRRGRPVQPTSLPPAPEPPPPTGVTAQGKPYWAHPTDPTKVTFQPPGTLPQVVYNGTESPRPQIDRWNDQQAEADSAANVIANQYETWFNNTQDRALGGYLGGVNTASQVNGLNNRALEDSAGNQLALSQEQTYRNGLDMTGLGLTNNLLRTQLGLAGEQRGADIGRIKDQWALRNGQHVSDQDYIKGVWGRATEQHGADTQQSIAMADQARLGYGYAGADLENSTNRANLQESTARRGAMSAAAGAGAFGSAGFRDNVGDITELAGLNRDSAWNTYEQQRDSVTGNLRDISYGRGNLDRRYTGDVADFEKQLGDNDRNYQGDINQFQYGIGQANRNYRGDAAQIDKALQDNTLAMRGLESMARSYGIQRKDIVETLKTATERHNINLTQLISEMNTAYSQGNQDRIFQFQQFVSQLIGA